MCGIAGKAFWPGEADTAAADLLRRMADSMIHRGPDEDGFYVSDSVALCMRRLQVIDLDSGSQPMSNEDGSLRIVFNGEIYNYRQLRRELESAGHVFATASDTETILHLYEDLGAGCVQRLHGMFAIAIWDTRERSLFLARDRLGVKPLHYAHSAEGLTFASELSGVLCDPQVDTSVDPLAIDEYLTYLFVPHPRTIYRGVSKLPPGTWALYRRGELTLERYWEPAPQGDSHQHRDVEDLTSELDTRLRSAVQSRLVSDVPLGAFLSGGLDSSLVVALMQEALDEPVRTFSIGFTESSFNELSHARAVAEVLGTEHREFMVTYDIQDLLGDMLGHFGEPFADSSAIPAYHLSKVTRTAVTVALSGDGGDEVFGGYRRYRARLMADAFNRWPLWLGRGVVASAIGHMREPAAYYGTSLRKKVKRFLEFAATVQETPQTSWAFFLTAAKSIGSTATSSRARCAAMWARRVLPPISSNSARVLAAAT